MINQFLALLNGLAATLGPIPGQGDMIQYVNAGIIIFLGLLIVWLLGLLRRAL